MDDESGDEVGRFWRSGGGVGADGVGLGQESIAREARGPAEERGGVRATIDGSAWTESRLWKAGYREDQKCACGHEVGNTPHRVIRCPLHSDDRAGLSELFIREVEGFLGDEVMSVRAHRLFPMMKKAYPAAPGVADTVIQEVRWREGHGTGYHDTAEWDEEDAAAMDEVRLDGVKMSTGHEFSVEVLEECRRWKERERRAGSMPQDPIEGWVCTDGSALDGNGQAMSRVGASLVQMGGGVDTDTIMRWEEQPPSSPQGYESVLLQPRGRQAHKRRRRAVLHGGAYGKGGPSPGGVYGL